MNGKNVVIGAAAAAALYLLWVKSQGGSVGSVFTRRSDGGWGAPASPSRIYDPTVYAGGTPSTAGSNGVGNMNPLTTALSTVGNLLKGLVYRQSSGSAPASYGKSASPGAPGGPSTRSGAPSLGPGFQMNQGALLDPVGLFEPTMGSWWDTLALGTGPANIQSQGVSSEIAFPVWY